MKRRAGGRRKDKRQITICQITIFFDLFYFSLITLNVNVLCYKTCFANFSGVSFFFLVFIFILGKVSIFILHFLADYLSSFFLLIPLMTFNAAVSVLREPNPTHALITTGLLFECSLIQAKVNLSSFS